MSTTTRRILLSCAALAIVISLCVSVILFTGAGYFLLKPASRTSVSVIETVFPTQAVPAQTDTSIPSPVKPTQTQPVTSTSPSTTPELQPSASPTVPALPPDITRQMDEIQQQVIALRGLHPTNSVVRDLLTPDQLRQKVINDFYKDYTPEEAQMDAIVLSTFGLLQPGFDLLNFYVQLDSEQIAGSYDNKTKEMYVVAGTGFNGYERFVYAHEYDHALQDQNYDIQNGLHYNDETCKKESERCAAIQSLIEGDATFLQFQWYSADSTSTDRQQINDTIANQKSPVYDSAPDFMKEDLLFPYDYGEKFVQYLYSQGGWDAVDQAYRNVPLSTEQIMHTDRYPDDKPITVTLPDLSATLGSGWKELDRDVMGEWYTYLILAHGLDPKARLDENTAQAATDHWGGDAYVVYYNDQSQATAMVLTTVWDSDSQASKFTNAFQQYATKRFGNPVLNRAGTHAWESTEGYTEFHINGAKTTWIFAPDSTISTNLWKAVQNL